MKQIAGVIDLPQNNRSKMYALFLALFPVVMMYRVPGVGVGFATALIFAFALYAGTIVLKRGKSIDYGIVLLYALFLGYVIFQNPSNNTLIPIVLLIHITAISTGVVDENHLREYLEKVSIVASFLVLFQQLIHILIGVHIPFVISGLLTDELSKYSDNVATGLSFEGLYRPCAFFLEPSHFSQYTIFGLGSALFRDHPRYKRAIIISLGLFATTSGLGFALAFVMWGWWKLMQMGNKRMNALRIAFLVIGIAILIYLLSYIPFFNTIVVRFTGTGDSGYNAINGRLFFWDTLFGDVKLEQLWLGYGEVAVQRLSEEEIYFTGFMKQLYAYGIIGFTFFSVFLLYLLFHVKNSLARIYVIIYIVLLFFTNLTGFIQFLFNIGTIWVFSDSDRLKSRNFS